MDDDEFDPLARRCEQAKAWTAGSLAVLLGSFVIGVQVVVAVALIGVIFGAGRWIQLGTRLRERDHQEAIAEERTSAVVAEDEPDDSAPVDSAPTNIIQFPIPR